MKLVIYDTIYAFFAGIAMFSVVGYLRSVEFPVSEQSGLEMMYIGLPSAIHLATENPRFWSFCLFGTFFTFGMDTVIGWVETIVTTIHDIPNCRQIKRKYLVVVTCVLAVLNASVFTSNFGFTYRSILVKSEGYCIITTALLQSVAGTWVYKYGKTCENFSRRGTRILCACYWTPLLLSCIIHFIDSRLIGYAAVIFLLWMILVVFSLKFFLDWNAPAKFSWGVYLTDFVCYGSS